MVTSIKQAKRLASEFNKLQTDKQRLVYVQAHPEDFMVYLDNDGSHVSFIAADEDHEKFEDIELNAFYDYFGCSDGVYTLFEVLGIRAESV